MALGNRTLSLPSIFLDYSSRNASWVFFFFNCRGYQVYARVYWSSIKYAALMQWSKPGESIYVACFWWDWTLGHSTKSYSCCKCSSLHTTTYTSRWSGECESHCHCTTNVKRIQKIVIYYVITTITRHSNRSVEESQSNDFSINKQCMEEYTPNRATPLYKSNWADLPIA